MSYYCLIMFTDTYTSSAPISGWLMKTNKLNSWFAIASIKQFQRLWITFSYRVTLVKTYFMFYGWFELLLWFLLWIHSSKWYFPDGKIVQVHCRSERSSLFLSTHWLSNCWESCSFQTTSFLTSNCFLLKRFYTEFFIIIDIYERFTNPIRLGKDLS